jgi:MOSC domain-containing protein YiiM
MQKKNGAMHILSVNVGAARALRVGDQEVLSGIVKRPVAGLVSVRPLGLEGDEQADPSVHGGLAKAVYAYPAQHFTFWQTVRAQARVAGWDTPVPPGLMGENLTVEGVAEDRLWIGDRLVGPGCVLAVSEPRLPCAKFGAAMGFAQAPKLMAESGFCGAYLAVIEPGTLAAGQTFRLEPGPREVNLRELFRARMARRSA